ncbi:hypothetical protein KR044_013091, partial [Drosophila immigrans]
DEKGLRRPRWWFSGLASTTVASVVAPFDLIKTHMQTQTVKRGMIDTARNVIRLRGYFGFYDGFPAAALRQMCGTSMRFTLYELGKNCDLMHDGLGAKIVLASMVGTAASAIGIPLDVINVRMQTDMKASEHEGRRYKCLWDALIRIPREEGWMGFYNGGFACVLKSAIGTIGQIAVYDHVTTYQKTTFNFFNFVSCQVKGKVKNHFDMNDDIKLHIASSVISSVIDSVITQPFDVLKTLMMNAQPGQFPTMFHAAKYMMRFGVLSPYRGLLPTLVRKVPSTIMLYVIYEQLRLKLGILEVKL